MKRIALFMILALCLALVPVLSWAGQTTGSVGIGIQGVDIDDSREGAAEYLTADQGGNATLNVEINGLQNGSKYDLGFKYLDDDDFDGRLDLDLRRYFRTKNSYQKFIHWLENDDLVNHNVDPDFAFPTTMGLTTPLYTAAAGGKGGVATNMGANVAVVRNSSWGDDMYVTREELVSDNEFIIPGAEFIKIHAQYRLEQREGYEQSHTSSKCGGCHHAADRHKIDEKTQDFRIGATAHLGLVTLDYTFLRRTFDEDSKPPVNEYVTVGASDKKFTYFGNEGDMAYSSTPDSEKDSHIVKAQVALAMNTTLFGSYVHTEIDNETATDNVIGEDLVISDDPSYDYDAYAVRLTSSPVDFMTMSFKYRHEDLDADEVVISYDDTSYDPQGANSAAVDPTLYGLHGFSQEHDGWPWERESSLSRETDTYGANFKFKVFKRTNLLVSWEREVDDVDAEWEETADSYSIALSSRAVKNLSLRLAYTYEDIDDPFAHENAAYANPTAMQAWLKANVDPVGCTPATCSVPNLYKPGSPKSAEYYVMYNSRSLDLTSEPESVHKFKAHATYNVSPKITLSGHFHYTLEEVQMDVPGHRDNFDKEMYALGADLFFAPLDNLTFTFAYNYMDMEDQAFLSTVAYGG